MANVYLSIGSNVNRSENIRSCIDSLAAFFGQLSLSPVYESTAVGFEGDNFYNLVVGVETCLLYTSPSPRDKRQSRMPSSA